MADDLEKMKSACARVVGAGSQGTGYVVAPQRIVTCHHVVAKWSRDARYEVFLGPTQQRREAWLLQADPDSDAAVVAFENSVDAKPLPLASAFSRTDAFLGYGYPQLANKAGLAIEGVIQDPKASDQDGRMAVQIFSNQFAAGQASPLHGFSGSPILVGGSVVGHLTRQLGDPDDRKRAAYGIAYACPVAQVRKLLDAAAVPTTIREITIPSPSLYSLADAIPGISEDEYHVFVSYRSQDRPKARVFVERMEGAGLRVFYDQKALKPGDLLPEEIEKGLTKSRSAVVLVSRGWLESPWCQQEANLLIKRAVEQKGFRLIPVRLDDSEMPKLLDTRLWIDFKNVPLEEESWAKEKGRVEHSEGTKKMEELLWSVVGEKPPAPDSTAAKLGSANIDAVQQFIARLRIAARAGTNVSTIWQDYLKSGLSDDAPALLAAESLIQIGRPGEALAVLDQAQAAGLRARQLRALALAKSDRNDEAIELLEELHDKGHVDPETAGILAGRYKQRWRETGNRGDLMASHRIYRSTWERSENPFNGINAAATALWLRKRDEARDTAVLVRSMVQKRPQEERSHWEWAILGEACLVLGSFEEARNNYEKAVSLAPGKHQDIAVMRRQARQDLEALGRPRGEFDDVFPVPNVVAFFGHMTDLPGRPNERFPERKVAVVRKAIRERLKGLGFILGFSGAARGADIVFLEEVLDRKGLAHVKLPFPVERFLETSAGGDWNRRFRKIQRDSNVKVEVLHEKTPSDAGLPEAFRASNIEVQKHTAQYAKLLDETAIVIAAWDGKPGDGPGGTADAVQLWEADGYEVDVISI